MRNRAARIVASLTMLILAGCSGGSGGTEPSTTAVGSVPTAPASSGSDSSRTEHGAPKVSNPLDASKYLTQPCAVLTQAQLRSLDLPKPGVPDLDSAVAKAAGPGCTWSNTDALTTVGVGFLSGNKKGLDDTYRGKERFDGYFDETSVDGYPAVFNSPGDARGTGACNLTVGLSDTLTFRVGEQGQLKGRASCDRAKQVASLVIQTIKGGSG